MRTMWFIGVEVEQDTSATPPKKNPGSASVPLLPQLQTTASPEHKSRFGRALLKCRRQI